MILKPSEKGIKIKTCFNEKPLRANPSDNLIRAITYPT